MSAPLATSRKRTLQVQERAASKVLTIARWPTPHSPHGHIGDGTHGCIGLSPAVAKRFFAALMHIPHQQRPHDLEVIPPLSLMDGLARMNLSEPLKGQNGKNEPTSMTPLLHARRQATQPR